MPLYLMIFSPPKAAGRQSAFQFALKFQCTTFVIVNAPDQKTCGRRFFGREHSQSQMSYTGISGQIEMPIDDPLPLEGKKSLNTKASKESLLKIEARELPPRGSLRQSGSATKVFQNQKTVSASWQIQFFDFGILLLLIQTV